MAPVLLLLVALQAQDPVQVRARLNDEQITAGETTVLRVDVETDGERARIERFRSLPPGLELQGTRDFDQRQFSLPGGTRRFVSREFVLRARAPGRYRIPSLDIVVDNQTYTTRSLILTVTAAPARARGEQPEAGADGVVLRAWLDQDTVFVGEQVTLQAEAMFSQDARLRLRRAPEYEAPSPSGFWIHELPDPRRPVTRSAGGQIYEVQQFRRAFFPLSPGDYEIPPARLEYEMRRGLLYAPETRELTSDPLPLTVLPVPRDQPPAFTGAVGSYTLRSRLEPARVPAGEAAVLTVEVDGVGNVKALPPPALPELEAIEAFPPSEEAELRMQGEQVAGTKRFRWVLIPREAGDLEIPEIRYAFFDPDEGGFSTASVPALTLHVTPGTRVADAAPAATLRYLQTRPGGGDPLAWARSGWFAGAQALPLLLLSLALAWRGRARRGGTSIRALRRQRRDRVRALEERAEQGDPGVFGDADRFARQWLADRLGVATSAAGRPAALAAAGVSQETASAVRGLLDRLSSARYAPTPPPPATRRDLLRALARLLERVDREAPAPARRQSARAGTAALLLLIVVAASTAAAPAATTTVATDRQPAAEAPGLFARGIAAFDEERYGDAAEAFDGYVSARPEDPAGWYNLGTAYHRAGHPGYAVWAWLHVPSLDPRHDDVRHNLRVAGVPPELVARAAPPLPLRASELFLLASLAWLGTGIAGAWWLTRRRRSAAVTAGATLMLAIAAAAAGWASTATAETAIVLDSTTLRAGPTLRAEPVAQLAPGTGLEPVETREAWTRARTLQGDEGWIETDRTGPL